MINFFRKLSFRYKIVILSSSIAFIALISFHTISNRLFSSVFMKATTNQAISALELTNQNLNLLLQRSETYIRLLSINTELQDTLNRGTSDSKDGEMIDPRLLQSLSNTTSGVFAPTADVLGCIIYINGKVMYPQNVISASDAEQLYSEEYLFDIYRSAAPAWKTSLSQINYKKENDTKYNFPKDMEYHVITLSKQIIDRSSGHKLGIISLIMEEKALSSVYDTGSSDYYLVNQENMVMSCLEKSKLNKSVYDVLSISEEELGTLRETSSLVATFNNKQYMVTLIHNDVLKWDLIALTDLTAFMNNKTNVTQILLLVCFATLLITFFAILGSASAITKPITMLLDVMKAYDGTIPAMRVPNNLKGEMRVLGLGINQLLDKIEHNISEIEKIQNQKRKYELRILQEQIQPHFLYNALQTATSLVQLGLYDTSIQHLYALSDFYRLSLNTGKDLITLRDELKIVEDYLLIQRMRYINVFDYSIKIDEECFEYIVPKLTLQPLVENAIYHGLKPQNCKGSISILAYQVEEKVVIKILDTGIGMTEEEIENILKPQTETSSYGVRSVLKRLALIYENNFAFRIDSQKGQFTSVIIELNTTSKKE